MFHSWVCVQPTYLFIYLLIFHFYTLLYLLYLERCIWVVHCLYLHGGVLKESFSSKYSLNVNLPLGANVKRIVVKIVNLVPIRQRFVEIFFWLLPSDDRRVLKSGYGRRRLPVVNVNLRCNLTDPERVSTRSKTRRDFIRKEERKTSIVWTWCRTSRRTDM